MISKDSPDRYLYDVKSPEADPEMDISFVVGPGASVRATNTDHVDNFNPGKSSRRINKISEYHDDHSPGTSRRVITGNLPDQLSSGTPIQMNAGKMSNSNKLSYGTTSKGMPSDKMLQSGHGNRHSFDRSTRPGDCPFIL